MREGGRKKRGRQDDIHEFSEKKPIRLFPFFLPLYCPNALSMLNSLFTSPSTPPHPLNMTSCRLEVLGPTWDCILRDACVCACACACACVRVRREHEPASEECRPTLETAGPGAAGMGAPRPPSFNAAAPPGPPPFHLAASSGGPDNKPGCKEGGGGGAANTRGGEIERSLGRGLGRRWGGCTAFPTIGRPAHCSFPPCLSFFAGVHPKRLWNVKRKIRLL